MTTDQLKELQNRLGLLGRYLDVGQRKLNISEQKKHTFDPEFWNDPKRAQKILKVIQQDEHWVKIYDACLDQVGEVEVLQEFYELGETTTEEVEEMYLQALKSVDDLEFQSTLNEPEDSLSCMLKINAGAGGTESCDWASMLIRMYKMWVERKGFKCKELNWQDGDVAGIKTATIEIEGSYAYGVLKGENGVHRLVRTSPFNAQGKRQTSFASVFVYPMVDDEIEVEINPADLSWDTFRASGAGGQHVNKTESAVRVRHAPSGVVIECQEQRSQHQNRERALQMLKSELYKLEIEKRNAAKAEIEGTKAKIEWGSQIRSYVLDKKYIKDHRSNLMVHNTKRVLDGDLDDVLKSALMAIKNIS
ncbi:MAG: peptide chain release factor 2 [Saprospiraceae bacterium]|nr:peptide chain release factor 2 [Saprospiraceae bacterium]